MSPSHKMSKRFGAGDPNFDLRAAEMAKQYWKISGTVFKVVVILGYLTIATGLFIYVQQVLCAMAADRKK